MSPVWQVNSLPLRHLGSSIYVPINWTTQKTDKLLKIYNLPRLNHDEIGTLNRSITSKETKLVIKKNLPKNVSRGQDGFTCEFYQIFREELTPILLKHSKNCRGRTFPNSFYEATITLIPKSDKDNTQKRKLQANITDEHRCKNPQPNSSKQKSITH